MQNNISKVISMLLKIIFIGGLILIPFMPAIYDLIGTEKLVFNNPLPRKQYIQIKYPKIFRNFLRKNYI